MRPENYDKVKKAFIHLLSKKPFSEIEVKELASVASINRSSLYRNYEGSDIISSCFDEIVQEIMDKINGALEPDKTGDFEEMYDRLFDCIEDNASVLTVLLGSNVPQTFKNTLMEVIKKRYLTNVEKLYGNSYPLDMNKKRLHYCATFYANGALGLFKSWLENNCEGKAEALKSIYMLDEAIDKLYGNDI